MDKQKVLSRLVWDLQSFLSVLDSENLSYIAQAQKKSLSELLSTLHSPESPVEDAEYMVMSCPSSSPTNEPTDSPGPDLLWSSELVSKMDPNLLQTNSSPSVPPLPLGGLGAEEEEEDTYEEAAPYVPESTSNNTEKPESDSSHYESYGDDDDDDLEEGAGLVKDRHFLQWSASQPCLRPAPESRLCSYLWRRKWLGQWTKQLFIIKNHSLLCYKCARDLLPQMDLDLRGSVLVYKSKPNRKIPHQLKVVPVGSESLVLGYSSFQHADEWRKVMEELSSGDMETHRSEIRAEPLSCRSSAVQTDSDEDSAPRSLHQVKGFLNVLMNCQWQSLQCEVENGVLNMFAHRDQDQDRDRDRDQSRSPQYTVSLTGCEVRPGPDTDHSFRITLSTLTDQLAVLEVSSSEEKDRWLQLLKDQSKPETTPAPLSALQTRRFPTSNPYDPFDLSLSRQDQHIYSNTSVLEHMLNSSKDSVTYSNTFTNNKKKPGEERCVQRLELAGKTGVQLRAGSEVNLSTAAKQNKRSSFRQSLAVCSERAQAGFLNPLLRRTASAKVSLKRAPSALFIESGKVFQRKKEWETKAAA